MVLSPVSRMQLRGEMAVRWSAVEILRESKYSRASDVWSFGVLMFELMSDGAQPYSDFPSLQALSEAVVNGHRLSNPRGCSAVVFARLLEPCWHVVPAERPGFRKLQEAFLDLGVIAELPSSPTSITENSTPDSQNRRPSQVNGSAHRVGRAESENIVMDEKKLLGASVHHLSTVFAPEVYEVVGHDASIRDAVSAVVKPNCACKVCPHDGGMGSSYVDSLVGDNHVGMSNALLSYTWAVSVAPSWKTIAVPSLMLAMFAAVSCRVGCVGTRIMGSIERSQPEGDVHLDLLHVSEPTPHCGNQNPH